MMDSKSLKRWLKDNGYSLEVMGNGHLKVLCPDGHFKGVIAVSPHNGNRSTRNDIANLRRQGVPLPRK